MTLKRKFRIAYHGDSRTTAWRRKQEQKRCSKGATKITTFFRPVLSHDLSEDDANESDMDFESGRNDLLAISPMSIEEAIISLDEIINVTRNVKTAKKSSDVSKFDLFRYLAIATYLRLQQKSESQNKQKMIASRQVAEALFPRRSISSMSRRIREWAKQFLSDQALSDHRQENMPKHGRSLKTRTFKCVVTLGYAHSMPIQSRHWLFRNGSANG